VSTSLKFVSLGNAAYLILLMIVDTILVSSVMTGESKILLRISGLNHLRTSHPSFEQNTSDACYVYSSYAGMLLKLKLTISYIKLYFLSCT
jgi:hypothetical protein